MSFYSDGYQVEQASLITPYCDGALTGLNAGKWNGTAHASTSTCSYGSDGDVSGATWQQDDLCVSGKCLKFNGSSDFVRADSKSANITGDISISVWVKPKNPGAQGVIIHKNGQYSLLMYANYQVSWADSSNWSYANFGTKDIGIQTGKWNHIVVTKTGGVVRIYNNGIEKVSQSFGGSLTTTTNQVFLGCYSGASSCANNYFNGFIDDVKLYSYALSADQVKTDYNSRGSVKGSSVNIGNDLQKQGALANGLVGYWKMDESISPSIDSSGNGNSGTWANSPATTTGFFGNGIDIPGAGGSGVGPVVNVSDSDSLDVGYSSSMTVSFWLKNDSSVCAAIVKKAGMWEIFRCSNAITVRFDGASPTDHASTTNLANNQWYLVTLTREHQSGKTILYLNGLKSDEWTFSASNPTTTNGMGIGAYYGGNWAIDGKLDEVRIYNRTLSPTEVSSLYNWAPGPVGYWNFEEGQGESVNDISGNNNKSSWFGSGSRWTEGKYGKGGNFNGSNDYIEAPNSSSLNITGAITLEAWVKPRSSDGNWSSILSKTPKTSAYYIMQRDGVKSLTFGATFSGSGYKEASTQDSDISLNTWQHIAATYDGVSTMRIYVNGVQKGINTTASGTIGLTAQSLIIGASSTSSERWNGQLDEIKIYNYARTPGQIVEDMNAGHTVGGSPVGSQLAYFKIDEGYGSTAYDAGPNKYNATTYNSPIWTSGKLGKALQLNGSNTYLKSANLGFPTNITVSAWIKVSNFPASTYQYIVNQARDNYCSGYSLGITTNQVFFNINTDSADDGCEASSLTSFTDNRNWHHIVGTYDGTNAKVYIDGVLKNTTASSQAGDIVYKYSEVLNIGKMAFGEPTLYFPFDGLVDEVKIYNTALTADQIKLDYNNGSSLVLGSFSDTSQLTGGSVASNSASAVYCIPGDNVSCNSPILEWNFEEKNRSTINNSSGGNYSGNLTNSPTWVQGQSGWGLKFNGSNNYVQIPTLPSITAPYTVEFWFKPEQLGASQAMFSLRGANSYPRFSLLSNNKIIAYAGGEKYRYGTKTFATNDLNKWWHAAFVVSDSSSLTNWKVYLNGADDTGTAGANTGTYYEPSAPGYIGNNQSYEYFKGSIDQIKVFNYIRTPAQIAWDYNQGKPVGHWQFDECQGATAYDSSGNGNSATLISGGGTAIGTCATAGSMWGNGSSGKFNSSIYFDGDDYLQLGSATPVAKSNQITVTAWYKPNGAQDRIINRGWCNAHGWLMHAGYGFGVNNNTGCSAQYWASFGTITNGNWYFLTGVFDGSKTIAYKNGVYQNQTNASSVDLSQNNYNIDMMYTTSTGQLDDVRIYNYALTPTQIKTVMNQGSAIRWGPATGAP